MCRKLSLSYNRDCRVLIDEEDKEITYFLTICVQNIKKIPTSIRLRIKFFFLLKCFSHNL